MADGEAGGEDPQRRRGPVAIVLNDRVYRTIFLILVVQGVMFGGQMPFMPLWAKDQLGAGSVEVGTVALVSSLVTTGFGLAYGIVTDRTRRRVSWIAAAYAVALPARVALAYVTSLAVGAVLYALVGMAMFVLFYAILGDWLRHRQDPQRAEVMNIVRLGFTLGWLTGAFGAGWFVTRFGYDGMFLGTAVLHALSMALLVTGVRDAPLPDQVGGATEAQGTPLWVDLVRHVDDVRILEAAHHVGDGIRLADVREELVAEALALGGAGHQARDVDELDHRRDDLLRLDDGRQAGKARIGDKLAQPSWVQVAVRIL